jgi:hypothetical protein
MKRSPCLQDGASESAPAVLKLQRKPVSNGTILLAGPQPLVIVSRINKINNMAKKG